MMAYMREYILLCFALDLFCESVLCSNICMDMGHRCVERHCCPGNLYTNVCDAGEVCCLRKPNCQWTSEEHNLMLWPRGTYAIPKTIYGCPDNQRLKWHVAEMSVRANSVIQQTYSNEFDIAGRSEENHISLEFCVKIEQDLNTTARNEQADWPEGQYCVFSIDGMCPKGLVLRTRALDIPESHKVELSGWVPVTILGKNMNIYFCCQENGTGTESGLRLGPEVLFSLPADMQDKCPQVMYQKLSMQNFIFDLGGDVAVTNGSTASMSKPGNVSLHFCVYPVEEKCYHKEDTGHSYRGPVNFTRLGSCRNWTDAGDWWDLKSNPDLPAGDIRANLCRHTRALKAGPPCITLAGEFIECDVPECGFQYNLYETITKTIPVTSNIPDREETRLSFDGDIATCVLSSAYGKQWWQANLLHNYEVVAVFVGTSSSFPDYKSITVGKNSVDFLKGNAAFCVRNTSTIYRAYMVVCHLPLVGQYVSIQNYDFVPGKVSEGLISPLKLCEVEIYVSKKSICGDQLDQAILHYPSQVFASSGNRLLLKLNSNPGWCADSLDINPWILIDLLQGAKVTAIVTQGTSQVSSIDRVTKFTMYYGLHRNLLRPYAEFHGNPKIFRSENDPHIPETHSLLYPTFMQTARLELIDFQGAACLRFALRGCWSRRGNVASSALNITVSSNGPMKDKPRVLIDLRMDSCFRTDMETDPWVSIELAEPTVIQSIVVRTSFHTFYVTHKMCMTSEDKGLTYAGSVDHVSDGPCKQWHPLYRITSDPYSPLRMPERNFSLAGSYCRNYKIGDVPMCFIGYEKLRFCNVPQCEYYTYQASVYVSNNIKGDYKHNLCDRKNITGLAIQFAFICSSYMNGKSIKIVYDYFGFLQACEIEVYESRVDPPKLVQMDESVTVVCPVGTVISEIVSTNSSRIEMSNPVFDRCVEHYNTCPISNPVASQTTKATFNVTLGCKNALHGTQCSGSKEVTHPSGFLDILDYLNSYDQDTVCSWTLVGEKGTYIMLNISKLKLAEYEEPKHEANYIIDSGQCYDRIIVRFQDNSNTEQTITLTSKRVLYLPTSSATVQLNTCVRQRPVMIHVWSFTYSMYHIFPVFELEASFSNKECPGCGTSTCSTTDVCRTKCGYITSPGYPMLWQGTETRCQWRITVFPDRYIEIEFLDFDITSINDIECKKNYILLYDYQETAKDNEQRRIFGQFCNLAKPPSAITSRRNDIILEFVLNGAQQEGRFAVKYKALGYSDVGGNSLLGNQSDCRSGWYLFDHSCYRLYTAPKYISWVEGRQGCEELDSSMVTISSEVEMVLVHQLLSMEGVKSDVYIGLNDLSNNGVWKWENGAPLSYSNWAPGEPDGGPLEQCVSIHFSSIRPEANWRDIPCAYRGVTQVVCEYQTEEVDNTGLWKARNPSIECGNSMFTCQNKECVLASSHCDGKTDCFDASDETNCDAEGRVVDDVFECTSGERIPLYKYCDFVLDCTDKSDERHCKPANCTDDQFRCTSGQCVHANERCDLIENCGDGTDEEACVQCSLEAAFQCYDGTCIPRTRLCDGMVDCQGQQKEDESEECLAIQYESCLDYAKVGINRDGIYTVSPKGLGKTEVECIFERDKAITLFHHDQEKKKIVVGFEDYGEYVQNINYFNPKQHIKALKNMSYDCEQWMKVECEFAQFLGQAYFEGIDGQRMMFNHKVNATCSCQLVDVCADNSRCRCDADPKYVVSDSGYLRNKPFLPVTQFSGSDTGNPLKEWASHILGPLLCYQKIPLMDIRKQCRNGDSYPNSDQCLADVNQFGDLRACRDATHLTDCGSFECPDGYDKCFDSYCIPSHQVCDGRWNCPLGEDENNCGVYSCPGMLRCSRSTVCVPLAHLCDGFQHCPHNDDELFCDTQCPSKCSCVASKVDCFDLGLTYVPSFAPTVRYVILDNNLINLRPRMFVDSPFLAKLFASRNKINKLEFGTFVGARNLLLLDLSYNDISELDEGIFLGLDNLKDLILKGNPLTHLSAGSFNGLNSLPGLDLSELKLEILSSHSFIGLNNLQRLDLASNFITISEKGAFSGLQKLKFLNISGNDIISYNRDDYLSLGTLEFLHSDDYMFCCFVQLGDERCLPKADQFSSCEDLMSNNVLRSFLWILGLVALAGNLFVLGFRVKNWNNTSVASSLISNLAASDMLMAVYMISVASVDAYYRGVYIEHATRWRNSILCQILGVIATLSSEVSVLILFLLTADRLKNIAFPFRGHRLTVKQVQGLLVGIWVFVFLLAVIPLLPIDYFSGQFYSRAGVCIAIHLTKETPPGWEFSVAVFLFMNLVVFLFILFSYTYIYYTIKTVSKMAGKGKKADMTTAREMALIIFTDFFCWFPINVMGILALSGVDIPTDVYAWTVVFLLPVNSALNPILYTISSINLKQITRGGEGTSGLTSSSLVRKTYGIAYVDEDEKAISLAQFMATGQLNGPDKIYRLIKQVVKICEQYHTTDDALVNISAQSIYVTITDDNVPRVQYIMKWDDDNLSGPADDMDDVGKVLSKMLQAYTVYSKGIRQT